MKRVLIDESAVHGQIRRQTEPSDALLDNIRVSTGDPQGTPMYGFVGIRVSPDDTLKPGDIRFGGCLCDECMKYGGTYVPARYHGKIRGDVSGRFFRPVRLFEEGKP